MPAVLFVLTSANKTLTGSQTVSQEPADIDIDSHVMRI